MKLDDLVDRIRDDWQIQVTGSSLHAVRRDSEPADGYPPEVSAGILKGRLQAGIVLSHYGRGTEPEVYEVGPRSVEDVLLNVHHPFRYKPVWEALQAQSFDPLPEKKVGELSGVSERQIRKSRILGYIESDSLLDSLCVNVLKVHPAELYGCAAWIEGVDIALCAADFEQPPEDEAYQYRIGRALITVPLEG